MKMEAGTSKGEWKSVARTEAGRPYVAAGNGELRSKQGSGRVLQKIAGPCRCYNGASMEWRRGQRLRWERRTSGRFLDASGWGVGTSDENCVSRWLWS